MAELIKNLKIDNVIGLLKKPDISIAFGNVSGENSLDITTVEQLKKFLEESYDHDAELALVDKSLTEQVLTILTNQEYVESLDECGDNSFVVVYHLGDKDLIIWMETSGFMTGCDLKGEHDVLDDFVQVPHFYPTKDLMNDKESNFYHYVGKYPKILAALKEISIEEE